MSLRNARRTVQHITGFSCNSVHVREGGTPYRRQSTEENRRGITIQVQDTGLSTRIQGKN